MYTGGGGGGGGGSSSSSRAAAAAECPFAGNYSQLWACTLFTNAKKLTKKNRLGSVK